MNGTGRESLPDVWEWSGGPPEYPGVVGKTFRMSGSGQKILPDIQVWLEAFLDVWE